MKLTDKLGSPITPGILYEDRGCQIGADTCWIESYSGEGKITIMYEDGRINSFSMEQALETTKKFKPLSDEAQNFYSSTRHMAYELRERLKPEEPNQSAQGGERSLDDGPVYKEDPL